MDSNETNKVKDSAWYNFQEEICNHFINLGANASTNVKVEGVRGTSNIDVLVESKHMGTDFRWFVEAKYWNSNVTKEIVHAFFTVVQNNGADRGFIISKLGFQSGAIEAAKHTNISLHTFDELKKLTSHLFLTEILKQYLNRTILTSVRYWSHSKPTRIKYNLRSDVSEFIETLSCGMILNIIIDLISMDTVEYPHTIFDINKNPDNVIHSFNELTLWLNFKLNEIDKRILNAEIEMVKNSDFRPEYNYITPDVMRISTKEIFHKILDENFIPDNAYKTLLQYRAILIKEKELSKNKELN
jgi:restriction system protein